MFEQDYFQEKPTSEPTKGGRVVGGAAMAGLHLAALTFTLYSAYHGISATAQYRASSGLGMAAGVVGILTVELTLISLMWAAHNRRIVGAAQSIAAGITGAAGFVLACLAIVADSQLTSGAELSPWLHVYVLWLLPIAPAFMALGAFFVHELAPDQLRARREAAQRDDLAEAQFTAHMATMRAELDAAKTVSNLQLNARASAARQIASWYGSDQAQAAITATAMRNAPAMLRAIGINVDDLPAATATPAAELPPAPAPAEASPRRVTLAEMEANLEAAHHANGNGARPM